MHVMHNGRLLPLVEDGGDDEPHNSRLLSTADIWRIKASRQNSGKANGVQWISPANCKYCCIGTCDCKWTVRERVTMHVGGNRVRNLN